VVVMVVVVAVVAVVAMAAVMAVAAVMVVVAVMVVAVAAAVMAAVVGGDKRGRDAEAPKLTTFIIALNKQTMQKLELVCRGAAFLDSQVHILCSVLWTTLGQCLRPSQSIMFIINASLIGIRR